MPCKHAKTGMPKNMPYRQAGPHRPSARAQAAADLDVPDWHPNVFGHSTGPRARAEPEDFGDQDNGDAGDDNENNNDKNNDQNNDNKNDDDKNKSETAKDDRFYRTWDKFVGKRASPARLPSAQGPISAAHSLDNAVARCRAKVKAIVDECRRLNMKYSDPLFALPDSSTLVSLRGFLDGNKPASVCPAAGVADALRISDIFEAPEFFIDGADAADVRQGSVGDCWFLAGVSALSGKPELLKRLCVARDEECGVYGFVFHRDGTWFPEVIDDRLCVRHVRDQRQFLLSVHGPKDPRSYDWSKMTYEKLPKKFKEASLKGSDNLYFSRCRDPNETWLPLIEKAYAKAHLSYQAIEGGWAGEAIEDLTGGVASNLSPEDILDKDVLWTELCRVNVDFLWGCASRSWRNELDDGGATDDEGVVRNHAYTVIEARTYRGTRLLKVRNPWGKLEWNGAWSDGSKEWTPDAMSELNHTFGDDGSFWISLDDFLHRYYSLERTRLFGADWFISERWLSARVPRSAYFLDSAYLTHTVRLTTTQAGPVVLVLCQPDQRYFTGLEGRYTHWLHFRVSRVGQGDGKYLVRSMSESSWSSRSVNAEVQLEPGEYEVQIKITSWRIDDAATAAEAIKRFGDSEREKVLATGRKFDEALSRGDLRGSEREVEEATKKRRRRKDIEGRRKTKTKGHEERKRHKKLAHRIRDEKERKKEVKRAEQAKKREDAKASSVIKTPSSSSSEAGKSVAGDGDEKKASNDDGKAEDKKDDEKPESKDGDEKAKAESKDEDDEDDEDEISSVSSIEDDDWAWDSDLDGPLPGEYSDSDESNGSEDEFGERIGEGDEVDRWQATAVVGLRMYTQDAAAELHDWTAKREMDAL